MTHPKWTLPVIVISQFCCTSLWFAGNAVIGDLATSFQLPESSLGHLTSAVQFGFIVGTLVFALLTIADRFPPSRVFFICALAGALFNLGATLEQNSLISLLELRFATGFFLAGIYPVGMKIASDYYEKGLGKSLGFLVGALVLGTAFPHLLKEFTSTLPWRLVLIITSVFASIGGLIMVIMVPSGPYRKISQHIELTSFLKVFRNRSFRSAAFGYFGHMWELYAFWTFVPVLLTVYSKIHPDSHLDISLWSFIIIGAGGLACIAGGYIAQSLGEKKTAFSALFLSGLCCLLSPFTFQLNSEIAFISFLIFWGLVVIADSPLFSTLVAKNASAETRGTALTIVNCIGFSITIVSIQLINAITRSLDSTYIYTLLAIGPVLGLIALSQKSKATATQSA